MLKKIKGKKSIKELLEFGIINIDKPSGPTSFDTSEFVMKKLKLRKTSHFGTLDPKVTGVLPIALNRACKLTGFFLGEDKEYVGIMRIHEDKDMKDIQKVIDKKFIGKILQTPPIKSRVKRQEREREIKKFELLEQEGKDIVFRADVEGGTYIRKLISDLGDEMKIGAHMLELRRVRAGIFKEDNAVDLYEFEKAVKEYESGNDKPLKEMIIPAEIVSEVYKPIQIKKTSMSRIFHGSPIHNGDLEKPVKIKTGKTISIFSGNRFIGMFKVLNTKNIFAKSKFVLQPLKGESK
jgi:H/ACA ribonucleoprotein complex subunit 4